MFLHRWLKGNIVDLNCRFFPPTAPCSSLSHLIPNPGVAASASPASISHRSVHKGRSRTLSELLGCTLRFSGARPRNELANLRPEFVVSTCLMPLARAAGWD